MRLGCEQGFSVFFTLPSGLCQASVPGTYVVGVPLATVPPGNCGGPS